ncbi:hypothetical protein F4778DRAFT_796296 [Xylariomycetidae sp. FL2044]|nr:hypothetical protein F4778DRAFT_796296 [Xylariomycetidae sp. FL2044]
MTATSYTRTVLGPLTTTTWAPPAECTQVQNRCATCDNGWLGQSCVGGRVADDQDCWPPRAAGVPVTRAPLIGWGVYSPGLLCPSGYTSVVGSTFGGTSEFEFQFPLTAWETGIGCCPEGGYTGFTDGNGAQTCARQIQTGEVVVGACETAGALYSTLSIPGVLDNTTLTRYRFSAPMFQVVWQSTDVPSSSLSQSTATTKATTATSGAWSTGDWAAGVLAMEIAEENGWTPE